MDWTIKKEVIYILWNVLIISILVSMYSFFCVGEYNLYNIILFPIISIFAIAPFVITYVIINEKILSKSLNKEADAISSSMNYKKRLTNQKDELVEFNGHDGSKKIRVFDIIFLAETKTYVAVYYFNNGIMNELKLKMTLKEAREELRKYTAFYRCQKRWVVNLDFVVSLSANARGYLLDLKDCKISVPVSRNLSNEITNRLAK
jgi:DNA-binding LytR/AlgR family response regulator